MIELIELNEQKIKELYESNPSFFDLREQRYKDFASKLQTFEPRSGCLKDFIDPLELENVLLDAEKK